MTDAAAKSPPVTASSPTRSPIPATPPFTPRKSSILSKKHTVDVRVFLAIVCATMAISFSLGSMYGPVRTFGIYIPSLLARRGHGELDSVPSIKRREGWTKLQQSPLNHQSGERTDADVVEGISHRRKPTDHIADLGSLIDKTNGPEYRPAGQHLLVDIRNIASSFLDSEEALSQAMVDVVRESELTLLSYHCHKLTPAGVSCVGVLLESHISFHTWPEEGVITLDLFTCGGKPLIPTIPIIERLFGIPRKPGEGRGISKPKEDLSKVVTKWAHQLRGFRTANERVNHYLDDESDLAIWVATPLDYQVKSQVVSIETKYQRVDIWDILPEQASSTYYDMIAGPFPLGDPRYRNSGYVSAIRVLFLDGTIQSLNDTEPVYHEALVHPAMFAHKDPKRVAIVGGGEGATLREVLKHKTVDEAVMLEIDEMLVQISREHLPGLSDCSNQEGGTDVCFDDPRTQMMYTNAIEYFTDNFSIEEGEKGEEKKYDVIIVDALDPEDNVSFADDLYGGKFIDAMVGSLTEDGIIIIQVGTAPSLFDPPEDQGMYSSRDVLFKHLELRMNTMFVYEESRCGFLEPHSFVVGCKSKSCRNQWYAKSDVVDYEVYRRIVASKNEEPTLVHFDGSTQHGYKFTPKAWEDIYCLRDPVPAECRYRSLDLEKEIVGWEAGFEARTDEDGQTGIFTTRDIEEGSYIMAEELAASLFLSSDTHKNLVDSTTSMPGSNTIVIENFLDYTDKYGRESLTEGLGSRVVQVGPTILARKVETKEEANTVRIATILPTLPTYSPVFERNRRMFDVLVVASRDIMKGEEVIIFEG